MRKQGRIRGLAVLPEILRQDRYDSHGDSQKAVLINTRPNNIEPCQTTSRSSPRSPFSPAALLHPINWQYPWLHHDSPEICLLMVQILGDVMAQKRKERSNGERFIAGRYDVEVNSVVVVIYGEEGRCRVYRNHEKNAYYTVKWSAGSVQLGQRKAYCLCS